MGPAGLNPDIRQSERYFDKGSGRVSAAIKPPVSLTLNSKQPAHIAPKAEFNVISNVIHQNLQMRPAFVSAPRLIAFWQKI
jgi:hypothetical protein